jgi:hypothetical protein
MKLSIELGSASLLPTTFVGELLEVVAAKEDILILKVIKA